MRSAPAASSAFFLLLLCSASRCRSVAPPPPAGSSKPSHPAVVLHVLKRAMGSLVLEDGTVLRGRPFGLVGTPVAGEVGEFLSRTKVGEEEKESSLVGRLHFCLPAKGRIEVPSLLSISREGRDMALPSFIMPICSAGPSDRCWIPKCA